MPLQTWDEFLPTLIKARKDQGRTQSAVAAMIGVAPSAVCLWETRVRTPTQENATLWTEALKVKMPTHSEAWFSRKQRSPEPRHGTRNGYQWHLRNGEMPACGPCRVAAAAYISNRRRSDY